MQETLAAAIPKIMSALGNFANDGEIKVSDSDELIPHWMFVVSDPHTFETCHCSTVTLRFFSGAAEVICCQPEVQLFHHQTDSGQLRRLRVPTLQTHKLLLHMAP